MILINWRLQKLLQTQSLTNSFNCEKSLELYLHQIYESLLLTLRQQFTDMAYDIPSKKYTYARIKEIRGLMSGRLTTGALALEPMTSLQNGSPFFRIYWCRDIHGDYHQKLIWIPSECLSLLRYNGHTFID
ncbi:LOW QUALITY PROTEIN: hypothetical protein HZS_8132, partial [Henneguya salminicola]